MEEFIMTVRQNRKKEIEQYVEKGYEFIDEKKYIFLDSLIVKHISDVKIGIEVTEREILFFFIDKKANAYFTIIEIYNLLVDISFREGTDFIVDVLREQLSINEDASKKNDIILYNDKKYYTHDVVTLSENRLISPFNSSMELEYQRLFIILNLIQEKSNVLFSMGKDKKYVNGILRMLIVLFSLNQDCALLKEIGWFYDIDNNKFYYEKPFVETERSIRKYYLTYEEYEDILKIES